MMEAGIAWVRAFEECHRRQQVRRHLIAAGVTAVSIGLVGAMTAISPALAGPVNVRGITTVTVTGAATAPANDTSQAEAACGAGQLLVGGGYVIDGTSTGWQVYIDAPLNTTTWLAELVNNGSQPLNYSAYAVCAETVAGKKGVTGYTTKVVNTAVNVPANDTGEADATCPAGDVLTGGGYEVTNVSSNWSIYLDAPTATGTWTAEIDNEVPLTTNYTSFAVCLAKTNSKPVTALASAGVDAGGTVPANSDQAVDVSCGAHEVLLGGGYVMDSIGQDWLIAATAPMASGEWQVQADDLDSNSRDFSSVAECLQKA
jgi:archaellum component FlaF (FlaF/FlaG flagellin family)